MFRDSIFISYSQKDNKWLAEVKKHLSILEHTHQLVIWDDTKIKIGSNWKTEIEQSIKKCKIAILLVSNNFLASEFIVKNELPGLLAASKLEGVTIFNVIIDTCAFHLTDLKTYQCVNPKYPLEELRSSERKKVLVSLTTQLLEEIAKQKRKIDERDKINLNEEANLILVLTDLIKNGAKTITDIQNTTTLRRKIIVSALDKLQNQNYIVKFPDPDKKKKPSILWKVSELGHCIFSQFENIYAKIVHSNT